MMHTPSRRVVSAAAVAALVLLPTVADAQIGGFIKKKVGEKVADKVLGEQGGARAPKFSATVLEIDAGRIDQLLRGLDAEVAARDAALASFRDHEAKRAAWEKSRAEIERCHGDATAGYSAAAGAVAARSTPGADPGFAEFQRRMMALPEKEREALGERMEKQAEAVEAAGARGDHAAVARIQKAVDDDLMKTVGMRMPTPAAHGRPSQAEAAAMAASAEKMQADLAKCPTSMPPEPVAPAGRSDPRAAVRDTIKVAAVRASGLEEAQYAILRERVTAWLAVRSGKGGNQYVFTKGEGDALEARAADITAREKALLGEDLPVGWRI